MRNRAGQETARRIIDATRALLASGGVDAATVKAICAEAGVLPGSFYNLFGSKEDVIVEVVKDAILAVDPDRDGSTHDLADLVDAFISFVEDETDLARVYVSVALSGGITDGGMRTRMIRHHEARVERFASAIGDRRPDLPPASLTRTAEALLAALNGYTLQRMIDPDFDFAGHARDLLDMEPR